MRVRFVGVAVAVCLVSAALGAQGASAYFASGAFSATGSMSVGRAGAAAAPLPDGRVLVTGGFLYAGQAYLRSAESFNPTKGSFSPTGSMTVPRAGAAAAPLADGRVLIVGGYDGANYLKSAETFDPATGSFSPTGPLTVPRSGAVASPLPDGRVLVAGGGYDDGSDFVDLDSAEIFDPASGSFAPISSRMTVPRTAAATAPLPGGRVLIVGGYPFDPQGAEIFDPATGSFSSTGSMINFGGSVVAAPLPDGRVLVAGGLSDPGATQIFDPVTGTFSFMVPTTEGRTDGIAAPLPDGRVLLAGGTKFVYVHSPLESRQSGELFTLALTRKLTRAKVIVTVATAGTVTAVETGADKRHRLLKRTSASGGPGRVTLKLRPTARGRLMLRSEHRLQVQAKIRFAPARVKGRCVTLVAPCFGRDYALRETTTLTMKPKKRK